MQTARDFVAAVTELGTGVQHSERQGDSGDLLPGMVLDWDAATVVDHLDPAFGQDPDHNRVAESSQRLIDGVVHYLVNQVVQASFPGGADVHAGPLAYRLQ